MKVGVILPSISANSTGQPTTYVETRRWAQDCEALGFDSIWINDHLLFRLRRPAASGRRLVIPGPARRLGGLDLDGGARRGDRRVEIGSWVLSTSFRNPALLAKMAVSLDEVSAGRLILGLGAGWHDPEHVAFGFPLDNRVSRFEEAMQIIAPLLRTGEVDFHGQVLRGARLRPGPARAAARRPAHPHRRRWAPDAASHGALRGHVERPLPGRSLATRGAAAAARRCVRRGRPRPRHASDHRRGVDHVR